MLAVFAACGTKTVVVTQPPQTVVVTKVVNQTSVVTATAIPTATATAVPTPSKAPAPKNPAGTIVFGRSTLESAPTLNTVYGDQYQADAWGAGQDLFTWTWDKAGGTIDYSAPLLATSWKLAPDLNSVTVQLRKGVQFQGGFGEMTADDVAWTYNRTNPSITPSSIAPSASYLSALLGKHQVEVVDPSHVKFTFEKFFSNWNTYMLNTNGFVGVVIHSKKAYDTKGEAWVKDHFIGTGPFQVDSWTPDSRAILSRFDGYWGDAPKLDKVIVEAIPDDATRMAAMQTGELDSAELALKDLPSMLAGGFEKISQGNEITTSIIFSGNLWEKTNAVTGADMNTASSPVYINPIPWIGDPFNDNLGNPPQGMTSMERARLVRTAIAMSIDRASINKNILGGQSWPEYIDYVDTHNPNYKSDWTYKFDVAAANAMLDKAGYPKDKSGVRFEMPLFIQTGLYGGLGAEIGDALSGMFANIGISTDVEKYPYAVYRPGLVDRTATIPRYQNGDDGQGIFPFDWPKGIEATSLSRGGYCICFETPLGSKTYQEVAAEPDKTKRIQDNTALFDYLYHWALFPGVVAIPQYTVYNPNAITSWMPEPSPMATDAFWNVVPASGG